MSCGISAGKVPIWYVFWSSWRNTRLAPRNSMVYFLELSSSTSSINIFFALFSWVYAWLLTIFRASFFTFSKETSFSKTRWAILYTNWIFTSSCFAMLHNHRFCYIKKKCSNTKRGFKGLCSRCLVIAPSMLKKTMPSHSRVTLA